MSAPCGPEASAGGRAVSRPGSTNPSSGGSGTMSVADSSPGGVVSIGPAVGSVSNVMIGAPTSTVSPAWWWISVTTPAYGDGTSTAAFAVSTSTIGWLSLTSSPTLTIHC